MTFKPSTCPSSIAAPTATSAAIRTCVALMIPALLALGCGADHSNSPSAASLDVEKTYFTEHSTAPDFDSRDSVATGSCELAATVECRVYLAAHNGVQPCFVGTQYCVEGSWSHCLDSDLVDSNNDDALLAMEERFDAADDAN